MRRSFMLSWSGLRGCGLLGACLALISCSDGEHPRTAGGFGRTPTTPGSCATPAEGCACSTEGAIAQCAEVAKEVSGAIWCQKGERVCDGARWGACLLEPTSDGQSASLTPPAPGLRPLALGNSGACDNPCDPYCHVYEDDPEDLDVGPELTVGEGGLTLTPQAGDGGTGCSGLRVEPAERTLTVTDIWPGGALLGEYFSGIDKTLGSAGVPSSWTVTGSRLDSVVDFEWGSTAPGVTGIGADLFTVRWTGFVVPPEDGSYRFYVTGDDGVRLWIADTLVVNAWWDQGPTEYSSPGIDLEAGVYYPIRFEYYENGGGATARLEWSSGTMAKQTIPSSALLSPDGPEDPFTVSPETVDFAAYGEPDGCFEGEVGAAWTLDRVDRAAVDDGEVRLFSAVAGDVAVSAFAGEFTDSATVHVVVDALDVRDAEPAEIDDFDVAPGPADPTEILYPYDGTVFPLGLKAPVVQWSPSGSASVVKVSLRYPADGSVFSWAKIMNEPSPARLAIPSNVWKALEQTAKGEDVTLGLQRKVSGSVRQEKTKTLRFATAPLRGKIYYTEYDRGAWTSSIIGADPGSEVAGTSVFTSDTNANRCPVCHTVSADGTTFATSDRSWSDNGGLASIQGDGSIELLSDFVTVDRSSYQTNAQDWRGFAWAPLTPDGNWVFSASNIWGNTWQTVVGIDTDDRTVSVPAYMLSGGNGTGLLARYYNGTGLSGSQWLRTDPRIDFSWGNGSPGAAVPSAFSTRWEGEVQAYTNETYTFELETVDGVRLWVDGTQLINQWNNTSNNTFSGTVAMTAGEKTPIVLEHRDTSGSASVKLYWSSPSLPRQLVPQSQLSHDAYGDHFVVTEYYDNSDFTSLVLTRTEPRVEANWGSSSPHPSIGSNGWSSIWRGRLQAPATGNLRVCAVSDDGVRVSVGGTLRIDQLTNGSKNTCSSYFSVTSGNLYDLEVRHFDDTGDASLSLEWQMNSGFVFAREVVPRERLFPPSSYAQPANGLLVTYYDNLEFNRTIASGASVQAFTRVEPNIDMNWGSNRPGYGVLTSGDSWTMRATGTLRADCTGVHEFEVFGDDGGTLWLNDQRVVNLWANDTRQGSMYLVEDELNDLKFEFKEDSGDAQVVLRWKPSCSGATSFTPIPSANLYPTGDLGTAGFVRAGGDNGNDTSYWAWETPSASGVPPRDATNDSPGRWNLGANVMMVPTFAPDGSKLAFIDGDSGGGAGWRKGLSVMAFDQADKLFSARRLLTSTWPAGDVMKWPAFESDSRSILFQRTTPGDFCCRNGWTQYGFMAPTNYYEDPGHLWSIDSESDDPEPVELKTLNEGERNADANKAYQPTMLPQPAGGYRWVVFTSTRPYGNTLNTSNQKDYSNPASYTWTDNYWDVQSMLWVAAIDDEVSADADRSHPAFWLPNQNYSGDGAGGGYVNERAYWVAESCRPIGTGSGSECEVDEDCCGGSGQSPTARCKLDSPPTIPATRHCAAVLPPDTCLDVGDACVSDDECCFDNPCLNGTCSEPPALDTYTPANFERVFEGTCDDVEQYPTWTFFEYQALTPDADARIEFYAESADDPDDFHTLPPYPAAVNIPGVALIATAEPPQASGWQTATVDDELWDSDGVSRTLLKITARFIPNSTATAAPTLVAWRQAYTCPYNQ